MSSRVSIVALLVLSGSLALGACDLVSGPGGRRAGVLEWDRTSTRRSLATSPDLSRVGEPTQTAVSVPDTVTAGKAFTVTVRTKGVDGCWEAAGTEVEQGASSAVVIPYDRAAKNHDYACSDSNIEIDHSVELTFAHPGEAIIRVRGRKVVGQEFNQEGEPIEVEKRIHVR
jgi:hypothetical protein